MRIVIAALLAATVAAVQADPLKHMRGKFVRSGRSSANARVSFAVSMPRTNEEKLEELFWAISTPGNPEYGKFRSFSELNALTASKPSTVKHVKAWLAKVGLASHCTLAATADAFQCKAVPVSKVEKALRTKMFKFVHPDSGRVIHRVVSKYEFPSELKEHVEFFSGLTGFPTPHYGRTTAPLEVFEARGLHGKHHNKAHKARAHAPHGKQAKKPAAVHEKNGGGLTVRIQQTISVEIGGGDDEPTTEPTTPTEPSDDYHPQSNDYEPQSNDYEPQSNDYEPQSNDYEPQSNDYEPPSSSSTSRTETTPTTSGSSGSSGSPTSSSGSSGSSGSPTSSGTETSPSTTSGSTTATSPSSSSGSSGSSGSSSPSSSSSGSSSPSSSSSGSSSPSSSSSSPSSSSGSSSSPSSSSSSGSSSPSTSSSSGSSSPSTSSSSGSSSPSTSSSSGSSSPSTSSGSSPSTSSGSSPSTSSGSSPSSSDDFGGEGAYTVPQTLRNLYSLTGATGDSSIIQSAIEFQDLTAFSKSDMQGFFKQTGVKPFTIEKKVGPFNPQPQAESTLDVQYLGSVGEGNTNWYWTEAQWMYSFTLHVLSTSSVPDIMSMSYGWAEYQQCTISPSSQPCSSGGSKAFVDAVNSNFKKMGAAGITLLAASGDSGAHGRTDPSCSTPRVHPAFPAASPYLTAVGATQIYDGSTSGATEPFCKSHKCYTGGKEEVCSTATGALITSGGGFSIYAARPSYQDSVVEAYLSKSGVTPGSGNFNPQGRGFPDVAALGHNYAIHLDGSMQGVDGTSCACPAFAGVLALLNAKRVSSGGQKIGFANPLLYQMYSQNPSSFNDITKGNNKCTEEGCSGCTGFEAAEGWDATTGLGTPNLQEMIKGLDLVDTWHHKTVKAGLRGHKVLGKSSQKA